MACRACQHEVYINDHEGYDNWAEISDELGHECTEYNCKHTCDLGEYYGEI